MLPQSPDARFRRWRDLDFQGRAFGARAGGSFGCGERSAPPGGGAPVECAFFDVAGADFAFGATGRSIASNSETVTNLNPFAASASSVSGIASTVLL
jgi:hypothetical protein